MLMAQCQSLLGACWLWYHPQQVVGELVRDNASKRSGCLYMALCKCREPLTLTTSTNFRYAIDSQFQSSVVFYPRSICAPCSECRNFHHMWFMGVTFESLYVESTIALWNAIFVGKKKVIAAVDLIIFISISFYSKYWNFIFFCLVSALCNSASDEIFRSSVCYLSILLSPLWNVEINTFLDAEWLWTICSCKSCNFPLRSSVSIKLLCVCAVCCKAHRLEELHCNPAGYSADAETWTQSIAQVFGA